MRSKYSHLPTLILGSAILAFGMFNIHSRSPVTEGGILGMTLFIQHWFGISPAFSGFVMDVSLFLLGTKYFGKEFLGNAVTASLMFSVFYRIYEHIGYMLPDISHSPLMCAIFGGIFVGVGVGLVVRQGGAAGGDDSLALVLSHKFGWSIANCYLLTDLTVLALSLSYIPFSKIAYSLVTVMISSKIIEFIQNYKVKA
ncbi:MAG: YitT family protein [Clostridia bacterium]|nr:YitT family protein [Clostridia bacterium]